MSGPGKRGLVVFDFSVINWTCLVQNSILTMISRECISIHLGQDEERGVEAMTMDSHPFTKHFVGR